jgi:hypothetical protein
MARHVDGMTKAIGSQQATRTATPSRSRVEGPCVLLNEKTRWSESGSATTTVPTTDPTIQAENREYNDFLVTLILREASSDRHDDGHWDQRPTVV